MKNAPLFTLPHICFIGRPNSGKSSLFNLLLEKEVAITSNIPGTTTDPVYQTTELTGFGRVRLIDTAGLNDKSKLNNLRDAKTLEALEKTGLIFYVIDVTRPDLEKEIINAKLFLNSFKQKSIILLNKQDLLINKTINSNNETILLDKNTEKKKLQLIDLIVKNILKQEEQNLLSNINLPNNSILVVIPFDGEAPNGRLILPQNKLIHDAAKKNIFTQIININNLRDFLKINKNLFDLVITDSKIFKEVNALIPTTISLTSFSILFARAKGELDTFYKAIKIFEKLKNQKNGHILIQEACTHTTKHEDIGTKLIPSLITKNIGNHIKITFDNKAILNTQENYDLIIHCGGCMISKLQMQERISKANLNNIPITNYGLVLAYFSGILDRAIAIFK